MCTLRKSDEKQVIFLLSVSFSVSKVFEIQIFSKKREWKKSSKIVFLMSLFKTCKFTVYLEMLTVLSKISKFHAFFMKHSEKVLSKFWWKFEKYVKNFGSFFMSLFKNMLLQCLECDLGKTEVLFDQNKGLPRLGKFPLRVFDHFLDHF